jgi:hypothetical protein
MNPEAARHLEGMHCTLSVERPAPGVVLVTFAGTDVGEFGDAPFRELENDVGTGRTFELFIDAHAGRAASIHVSNDWARWLGGHRASLTCVHMLTATKFVQLSADLVRRFADLGDGMRIYTDRGAFAEALAAACTVP